MRTAYVNGKFTAQRVTGVQRAALELTRSMDRQVPSQSRRWVLLCPPGSARFPLEHIERREVGFPGTPLHAWEQIVLPHAARDGLLVNLGGSAPWRGRRQFALLHDAAVFDHPEAYTAPFVGWYRLLFRRLARRGAGLLTVSAFSRARLAARLGVPPSRIGLVPNGGDHLEDVRPDDSVLARHGLRPGRFLLAVASANPTKNLKALLSAFARLPDGADHPLVIVGGGNRRVFARHRLPCPAGALHIGYQDDAALKSLYRHATALVCPSLYEGFGLPPLEAMACGCPVAVGAAAALPEVCGDAALYFDPRSVDDIAQALRRLLGDGPLRERLSRAGRERAQAFRWGESARLLQACVADAEGRP
ncbi:MAG: glycosyltransferase family 1 protein [Burkholderiaceae bacterium]